MGVDGTSRAGFVFSVTLKLVAVGGQRLLNTAYEHCNLHNGCPQILMPHIFSMVNRLFPVEAREHTAPLHCHAPCQHWEAGLQPLISPQEHALLPEPGGLSYFLFTVKAGLDSLILPQSPPLCPA